MSASQLYSPYTRPWAGLADPRVVQCYIWVSVLLPRLGGRYFPLDLLEPEMTPPALARTCWCSNATTCVLSLSFSGISPRFRCFAFPIDVSRSPSMYDGLFLHCNQPLTSIVVLHFSSGRPTILFYGWLLLRRPVTFSSFCRPPLLAFYDSPISRRLLRLLLFSVACNPTLRFFDVRSSSQLRLSRGSCVLNFFLSFAPPINRRFIGWVVGGSIILRCHHMKASSRIG